MDEQISLLWKKLQDLELLENTIIVILSDHGESLGEHQYLEHGHLFYQEQLHIPLIVVGPSWDKGRKINDPVRIVDLFPTILDQLQIAVPRNIQGNSLLPLLAGQSLPVKPVFAELDADKRLRYAAFNKNRRMIFKDWEKYIESSNGETALFHLLMDPQEEVNLAASNDPLASQMRKQLTEYFLALHAAFPSVEPKIDEETNEELKALGYVD